MTLASMPLTFYCDDIVVSGPMDAIKLVASLYAVTINRLDSRLEGNSAAFIPINPSYREMLSFNQDYLEAYTFLIPLFFNL